MEQCLEGDLEKEKEYHTRGRLRWKGGSFQTNTAVMQAHMHSHTYMHTHL